MAIPLIDCMRTQEEELIFPIFWTSEEEKVPRRSRKLGIKRLFQNRGGSILKQLYFIKVFFSGGDNIHLMSYLMFLL